MEKREDFRHHEARICANGQTSRHRNILETRASTGALLAKKKASARLALGSWWC
jgi:hypothetical protein